PGAEDQHGIVGSHLAAPAALHADGDRLGEARLVGAYAVGNGEQLVDRRHHIIGKAAILVRPDDPQIGAAVRLADAARIAVATAEERLNHDPRTGPRPGRVGAERLDVPGDLVPPDARIADIGVAPEIDIEI